MMARAACLAGFVAFSASKVLAAPVPPFDTATYCAEVAEAVGGSYSIEAACLDRESKARQMIESREIEPRILSYCAQVSEAVGGSFSIMSTCIDREERAKAKIQN
ncbi:hypothetical protein [Hwanghaeella sp.]|uniref:hypothetical protein n=1 Tax=Hwanghaeella sp. TaxID=2605943 RepID=UPI003CCC1F68